MTRVASFGHTQSLINSVLHNQARVFDTQNQIATGKKTTQFSGLTRDASTLLGAKSLKARTDKYMETLQQVNGQLNMNNVQTGAIEASAQSLRQTLLGALGQEQAVAVPESLEAAFSSIATALNTKIGANYIFAGSRTDTKPLNADSIADLIAAPTAASLFQNDDVKPSVRTTDNGTTDYGLLASDIGGDIMESIKRIADFNAGPSGPLDGPLTAAQRTFLETELGNLTASIDSIHTQNAVNGLTSQKTDDLLAQHQTNSDFLAGFISDIEDTDMTRAITNLNTDQTALQASYNVMAQLSKLSLLNFL